MFRKLISLGALGMLGLTAVAFGPAQANVRNLANTVGILPLEENVIQAKASKRVKAGPRRTGPRRAHPGRRAIPRRAVPRRLKRHRRHRFHGPVFIVPFGYSLYATHPCYDWRFGPRGWGYYWNYWRCPL